MADEARAYVDELARLGLIGADDAQAAVATGPADKFAAIDALRDRGVLTAFQVNVLKLGTGKPADLVMGNYVLMDRLGSGGMGAVLKARHRRMKRIVALKVLRNGPGPGSPEFDRFQREVEAAAQLTHPNVVTAYDADDGPQGPFLVMEYVEGSDLEATVKRHGPLPVGEAVAAIVQAARALAYAHGRGVIHRDIKPANFMRTPDGTIKVADMGLARLVGDLAGAKDDGLTQAGTVFGTVDYMSPEQALDSKTADARSDLYSLGCTLFYLLTARAVYPAETLMGKMLAHREQPVPALRTVRPDVPEAIDEVYQRMIAKKPAERLASMDELIRRLEAAVAAPTGSGTGGSWLLVEPSRAQSMMIATILKQAGAVAVRTATDGASALVECRRETPGLVVCTRHLPDMAGADLLAILRGDPALKAVPFILIASEQDAEAAGVLARLGRATSLPKPFGLDALRRSLAAVGL